MAKIWRRSSAAGRSMKKISSKRPFRMSSGGSAVIWLHVATRNTGASRSCIQPSSRPRMRRESPPSDSELTTDAKPFSISSIISTQGAMRSAVASARSRFFSDSPTNLSKSRPGSSLRSGRPPALATALAGRLLPQPWAPRRRMPRGGSVPHVLGGRVLAAPLDAQEEDAARRLDAELLGLGREGLPPLLEPGLEAAQAAHVVEALLLRRSEEHTS